MLHGVRVRVRVREEGPRERCGSRHRAERHLRDIEYLGWEQRVNWPWYGKLNQVGEKTPCK